MIKEGMTLWEANGVVEKYKIENKQEAKSYIEVKTKLFKETNVQKLISDLEEGVKIVLAGKDKVLAENPDKKEEWEKSIADLEANTKIVISKLKKSLKMLAETQYVITGIDKSGKRFKPIHTDTPQCYNIWKGTVWKKLENGKRHKMYEVWN